MPLPPFVTAPKLDANGRPILGRDGRPIVSVGIYEPKNHVRGYWLVSDPVTLTLAPGGQDTLRYLIDQQGHFDWAYLMGLATGPLTPAGAVLLRRGRQPARAGRDDQEPGLRVDQHDPPRPVRAQVLSPRGSRS